MNLFDELVQQIVIGLLVDLSIYQFDHIQVDSTITMTLNQFVHNPELIQPLRACKSCIVPMG